MASKNPFSKITRRTVLKGAGALMGSTARSTRPPCMRRSPRCCAISAPR